MQKKSVLLLHLFHRVLRPAYGRTSRRVTQFVPLSQHPLPTDHEAWHAYWKSQGQPWRTEPEIDTERQKELSECRAIVTDSKNGIYPFKGVKLSRTDIEWLLATHENKRGPVDWSDEHQREREGVDLRGADLRKTDLHGLPLARMIGNIAVVEGEVTTTEQRKVAAVLMQESILREAHLEGVILHNVQMQGAFLEGAFLQEAQIRWAQLEGVNLRSANLTNADLFRAHLEGANLRFTCLDGANLRRAVFDSGTRLTNLGSEKNGALISGIRWENVDLTLVNWIQLPKLGDELFAKHQVEKLQRLTAFQRAVRANRQIAVEAQTQALNEVALHFFYRAQILQRHLFRLQLFQPGVELRQRFQALGAWLFSWFLFLLAGYGYKIWRCFLTYLFVIGLFMTLYHFLDPHLLWSEAFVVSMTAFHGRGFSPSTFTPGDPLSFASAAEAFVGLIIEVTFIVTLTQRFFNR